MVIIRMKGGLGNQMFQYALYCELMYLGRQVKMDDVTGFRSDRQRDPALSVFGIVYDRASTEQITKITDSYMDPLWYFEGVPLRNSLVGVRFVDLRASLLPTDKIVDEAAFDKYTYIRDAYLQNRISEINDGNVPIEGRDDAECKLSRYY